MLMRSAAPRPAVELVPAWVTFCIGAGMLFPVTLVVRGIGFRGDLGSLVVLALAALWSIRSTAPAAAGLGTLCSAFTTGFIVNSFGTLTFGRQDLLLLAVCLGAPLAVCAWSRSTWAAVSAGGDWPVADLILTMSLEGVTHRGRRHLRPRDDRRLWRRRRRPEGSGTAMTAENVVGLVLAILLVIYLVFALIRPERF
ncbi:hypothetical protein GCM10023317_71980 [Actinopolymorpha pittospori]